MCLGVSLCIHALTVNPVSLALRNVVVFISLTVENLISDKFGIYKVGPFGFI